MEDPGDTTEKLLCKLSKKFAFSVVEVVAWEATDVTVFCRKLDANLDGPIKNNIAIITFMFVAEALEN